MQISDLLGQYTRNANQSVSIAAPTPESQKLVASIQELAVGKVFEGTVNEIKKDQIVLGLSNGETITARLNGNLSLLLGQSMFFQVKANNGNQVEIRPYTNGNLSNPTLLKALDAAGIPATGRTIDMVNSMMEENLPIDKQSLWEMAKTVAEQSDVDVVTIVQMKKLNIPVTPELANQFQNYKADNSAIRGQLDTLMQGLPSAFQGEGMTEEGALTLNQKILDVLLLQSGTADAAAEAVNTTAANLAAAPEANAAAGAGTVAEVQQNASKAAQNAEGVPGSAAAGNGAEAAVANQAEEGLPAQADYPEHTLGRTLSASQMTEFEQQLKGFPQLLERQGLFTEDSLNPNMTVREFLSHLQAAMKEKAGAQLTSFKDLFASPSYQTLLKDVIEQEWMIKPEDLQSGNKIQELYQRLEHHMNQLEQIFNQTAQDTGALAKAAVDVRGNIEFMNQLNQVYQYVQIPLKLNGQSAHGDLYVYSNKKNLSEEDGELTAFLHLDMEHLGPTDVSVLMQKKKVHTEFYLSDDRSYQLIMENVAGLQERLEKKGYDCTFQVSNQQKKVNVVEDFLKKDQPAAGRVHRYSFDVRA